MLWRCWPEVSALNCACQRLILPAPPSSPVQPGPDASVAQSEAGVVAPRRNRRKLKLAGERAGRYPSEPVEPESELASSSTHTTPYAEMIIQLVRSPMLPTSAMLPEAVPGMLP